MYCSSALLGVVQTIQKLWKLTLMDVILEI